MTDSVLLGFVSIALLVMINIAVAAFSYGMLKQQVKDACRRIGRLEAIANGHNPGKREEDK